jgi:membrane dipeptidase
MWSTVLASVGSMLSGGVGPRGSSAAAQTAENAAAALDVLRKSISVDVHTHGGVTGIMCQTLLSSAGMPLAC